MNEAIAKLQTPLLTHFGRSKKKLKRYAKDIKIRRSVDVVVQMKCSSVRDGAMPESDCCSDGESKGRKIHLHRLTVSKKHIIHFDKSEKKLVRLLPALRTKRQNWMMAELCKWVCLRVGFEAFR